MSSPELTDYQKSALDGADFGRYEDPILRTIEDWEFSADRWNHYVYFMYDCLYRDDFVNTEVKLAELQQTYADNFAAAVSAIAADSPIEDNAYQAIYLMICDEDARRREKLNNWYLRRGMEEPTDDYVTKLALAFGDPAGKTVMDGTEDQILSHDDARELFKRRLATQAGYILDTRRVATQYAADLANKRSLGALASSAFKKLSDRILS